MNLDAAMFAGASGFMALIFFGFLIWGIRRRQFQDNEQSASKPLADCEDDDDDAS